MGLDPYTRSSILGSPPKEEAVQDVGLPYDYATWKKWKEVFLKAKSSDRVTFHRLSHALGQASKG